MKSFFQKTFTEINFFFLSIMDITTLQTPFDNVQAKYIKIEYKYLLLLPYLLIQTLSIITPK